MSISLKPQELKHQEVKPQGLSKLSTNKWLLGLLILIPIIGVSYLTYHQFVVVPQEQAKLKVQTALVERSNLTIAISANGTVEPERSVNISPKTSGILKQLLVKEGDSVQQGQVLAYMDDSNLQGQLHQAQGNLSAAQANMQKLMNGNRAEDIATAKAQLAEQNANLQKLMNGNRAEDIATAKAQLAEQNANLQKLLNGNRLQEVAQAQAQLRDAQYALRQAQDDLKRNQQLYSAGAIALQSLNTSQTTRDRAQTQVRQAEQASSLMRSGTRPEEITQARAVVNQKQQALALSQAGSRPEDINQARAVVNQKQQALALSQAGSRPEDIKQARAQVASAQGAVQIIQANLNDTMIRAPFTGIIARKFADPGSFVTPTTAGSSVSSASSSSILALASTNQVVAQVAEANIAQIRMALVATIQVDAYSGKTFTGQVTQIATQSDVVQNVTSFEVKTSVSDPQHLLRSGMNVNVEFKAGELKNVLLVPTGAIVQQDKAQGVFVAKNKGGSVFVPIVVGITVNDKTEVKSGLTGNERVLLSFPPGTRKVSKSNGRPS